MRSLVLAACAGLLLVSGCSEGEAKPTPSPSVTTATSPPSPPPRAFDDSRQGATDFVSHYLRVLAYANRTGEVAELEELSAASCEACRSYIEAIEQLAEAGGAITGGERTFEGAIVRYAGPDSESLVTADVRIASGTKRDSTDAAEVSIEATTMRLTFGLIGRGQDRQVSRIFPGDPT